MLNLKYVLIYLLLFFFNNLIAEPDLNKRTNYLIHFKNRLKVKLVNDSARYLYEESINKINTKKYHEALMLLNKVIETDSNLVDAYLKRAEIKSKLMDYNAALIDYSKAINIKKLSWEKSYEIYFQKGLTLASFNKLKEAMASFDMAIKINPEFAEAYYNRSIIKGHLGDFIGEINDINKSIQLKPYDSDSYNSRGILKSLMGDYLGAISDYNKAIKINPNISFYYFNKAIILFELNEFYESVHCFNKAIELKRDADSFNRRGNAKLKLNDFIGAFNDYSNSINSDSTFYIAYLNRGILKYELKDFNTSIKDFDKCIELKSDYYLTYYYKGLCNCKKGRHIDEINDYSNAIFYKSDYEIAYQKRAHAKFEIGDKPGACMDIYRALSLGLNDTENQFNKFCR